MVLAILNVDPSYTFGDLVAQYETHFLCSDLIAGAVICSEIISDVKDFKKVFTDSFPAAQKGIWFPKGQFIRAAEISRINTDLSSDISNMKKTV